MDASWKRVLRKGGLFFLDSQSAEVCGPLPKRGRTNRQGVEFPDSEDDHDPVRNLREGARWGGLMRALFIAVSVLWAAPAFAQTTFGTPWIGSGEVETISAERHHSGSIVVFGTGRLEVQPGAKLFLTGHLILSDTAVADFDAAEFHLRGNDTHVLATGDAALSFRNGGLFHYEQTYVAQHVLELRERATASLNGTQVTADEATITIRLYGDSSFTATNMTVAQGDWETFYMWERSRLRLEGVVNAGDVVFYDEDPNDAVRIDAIGTIGLMPWLYFGNGAVADLSFPTADHCVPDDCPLVSKTIDPSTVQGIHWTVNVVDSGLVMWGFNSNPGSSVTVRDSELAMGLVRLAGTSSYVVRGDFRNGSSYADTTFGVLYDRTLRLVNTSVKWWKVDVIDSAQANVDAITFSEMMVKGSARALVTNSICEGQTIHLGVIDNGYVYFQDGEVWTHVSAWDTGLMVLNRSLVDWTKAEFPYQSRNIAHGHARLYAVNSKLVMEPEAADSALVTFARLGTFQQESLSAPAWTAIPVIGSAWIATGPQSVVAFDRWTLAIRPKRGTTWTTVASGTSQVRDALLATLGGRPRGTYELKLTILVRNDDATGEKDTWYHPAVKNLVVY